MMTAIDTNVLLDVFLPDPQFGVSSLALLERAYDQGSLIICDIVYAELVPQFNDQDQLDRTLERMNVDLRSIDSNIAYIAGERWARYRRNKGKRDRIITDFLIGAHALKRSDRLLTRDRGFYRQYFNELPLL